MRRQLPEITAIGFVVALMLAALVRDAACRHGLPYIMYWDEYAVTGAALKMMQERSLDPHFYGFGRLLTDDAGRYHLRTIKPGAYVARKDIGWWRPPHVHFSVVGSGVRLVTQMYFPGERLNDEDFIYMIVPEEERDRVIGRPAPAAEGDRAFEFDIVIRGRFQTPPDMD